MLEEYFKAFKSKNILRHTLETIVIIFVSSFPFYLFGLAGIIRTDKTTYFMLYGLSGLMYLALNFFVLNAHLRDVKHRKTYLSVNLTFLAIQVIVACALCVVEALTNSTLLKNFYTAIFAYTKAFRSAFPGSISLLEWDAKVISALIFYLIVFAEIMYFPVERDYRRKKLAEMKKKEDAGMHHSHHHHSHHHHKEAILPVSAREQAKFGDEKIVDGKIISNNEQNSKEEFKYDFGEVPDDAHKMHTNLNYHHHTKKAVDPATFFEGEELEEHTVKQPWEVNLKGR